MVTGPLGPRIYIPSTLGTSEKCESVSCSVVPDSLQPRGLQPARLLCPWDSPGKNTGVGCHFLLQGLFLTQGSNSHLLHCRQSFYRLSHQDPGKPWAGHRVWDSFAGESVWTSPSFCSCFSAAPGRLGTLVRSSSSRG